MGDIKDRFGRLPKILNIKAKDFYEGIGVTNTSYYQLKNGDSKPSFDTIVSILETFPQINADWLIKGIGQPLTDESVMADKKEQLFDYRNLVEKVNELETALKKVQDQLGGK